MSGLIDDLLSLVCLKCKNNGSFLCCGCLTKRKIKEVLSKHNE